MYLGIDFLVTAQLEPYVIEVNVGLPGGAQEYDRAHRVRYGKSSDIFRRIEQTCVNVYGKPFREYIYSLPFIESLKPFKIWMDGMGPYPDTFHPGLRLEDKWIQYQLLSPRVRMPETLLYDPSDLAPAQELFRKKGTLVLKGRVGRGGRHFQMLAGHADLSALGTVPRACLVQEHIESKVDRYVFSIRSIAFGGEFMCMYANLSLRAYSNHGILAFVSEGTGLGLSESDFSTTHFSEKSWESEIWFGADDPPYLRHNLYEDEVASTALCLPESLYTEVIQLSVKIERWYEAIDHSSLPKACFEQ